MSDLPRLVATDLDGTLLTNEHNVSARTRQALDAVREAGVEVLFVTARAPRSVHEIAAQAGHEKYAVCCNGAVRYNVGARVTEWTALLPEDTVLKVCQRLHAAFPAALFAVETGRSMRSQPGFGIRWDDSHVDVDTLDLGAAAKMFVRVAGVGNDELVNAVRAEVGDLVSVSHSGGPGFAEMVALGVSKVHAVKDFCTARGINSSDVLAFGDMPNDLELLQWAGRSWVTGNAHPTLRKKFPVTGANDEDGVAVVLERLLAGLLRWDDREHPKTASAKGYPRSRARNASFCRCPSR